MGEGGTPGEGGWGRRELRPKCQKGGTARELEERA